LLIFIEKATIHAPRLDQAGVWREVHDFLSQLPSNEGFQSVRHLRLDVDAITTSGFLAQEMRPVPMFHQSLFPGLRKITLDMELEMAMIPDGADDSDEEHDLSSEDSEEDDDTDFEAVWQDFDRDYDLVASLQRPESLREVRLVVWADSASPDYSSVRVVFLGDQIARAMLSIRQTSTRLSFEITVRNSIGVDQPALHVLMASMNRRLGIHRQQLGGQID
jgi:hypothetical protein